MGTLQFDVDLQWPADQNFGELRYGKRALAYPSRASWAVPESG
jgi:hypothetical protein